MNAATLVQKLWNYRNVLRDDGLLYALEQFEALTDDWGEKEEN